MTIINIVNAIGLSAYAIRILLLARVASISPGSQRTQTLSILFEPLFICICTKPVAWFVV